MEFIPPIAASAHPRFEVPWFGPRNKVYTPEGLYSWLYYPQHEGYNIKHVIEGDFHGKTWAEAAGFVQHWAYWGMILEFFQISGLLGLENGLLRHGQEPDDGTATLRTFSASLPYLILLWQRVHTNPETPNAEEIELTRLFKIIVILKRVNQFYTLLCSRETARLGEKDEKDDKPRQAQPMFGRHSHKHEQPGSWDDNIKNRPSKRTFFTDEPYSGNSPFESPGHALILSIGVVGELLCWATERKYKRKIDKLNWTIPLTIIRRMNLAGWCPVWLRRLQDEGSIIRACYLSSIPRSPPDRHTKCCAFGCIANQVNVVTYQTKHRNEGCDCQMVSFDLGEQSECANWIKMGHTPLIVSVNGEWKLVRGRDVESDKMKKYVAMSHVWADGTGNANGNALPSCQLRKFQTAANQLYNKTSTNAQIPFWVDTICVPFTKGETKTLAIRQMEQIYRDADKVLVFDSGLQQITLDTRASECLTQIEISSWNERLWTIQEAAFAKMLYFQFKDAITSLVGLHQRYRLERFARLASFRYGMSSETDIRRIPLLDLILDTHLQPVLREKALVKPPGIDDGEWVALDADALAKSPCDTEMDGLQLDTVFLGTVLAVSTFFNTLQLLPTESKAAQQKWSFLEKVLPYRQTSIVSDEGLCIATLLKMDQSSLHDLPDEERMRRMFLHVGTINCGILFVNALQSPKKTAQVTELGVKAKLPGLYVEFPPGGFLLTLPPDKGGGHFGFHKLDQDDEDGPGHLLADSFPVRLEGTDQMYVVQMLLPDGMAGIIAPRSNVIIILEQPLTQNNTLDPEIVQYPHRAVLEEWKRLANKTVVEGFLVNPATENQGAVEYRIPATLSPFDDPMPRQLATAALATDLSDVEWLIS